MNSKTIFKMINDLKEETQKLLNLKKNMNKQLNQLKENTNR
jgi:uncharacterized protein YukE